MRRITGSDSSRLGRRKFGGLLPSVLSLGVLLGSGCTNDDPPKLDDLAAPDLTMPESDLAMPDLATEPDLTMPVVDMAITPVKPCSWRDHFQEVYGHAFAKGDVAFVTMDNVVTRGMDKLNFDAQKTQVPDIVLVKGSASRIKEIQLLEPGGSKVLATRNGAHIYGLGYSMWLEVNGYGEAGITEMTMIRQFSQETTTYQQLVGLFRVLTKNAESQVAAGDRSDFQQAAAKLMSAIEGGSLTFTLGSGHAADFWQTEQTVSGKKFSFQLSNGLGMDPQLGFQRNGVWGPLWQTYSPGGNWSSSAPGMQPKCGGCSLDKFAGTSYLLCDGPKDRASAQARCESHGGNLATVTDLFGNSFLRGMAPNAGSALIGLNDLVETGKYVWATGKAATYLNWAPGQPDHYMNSEHCVQLTDNKSSTQWNDISCATTLPYLCQLP
jgi:hypothetical protein